MSYCRFEENSDVYLYDDCYEGWTCVRCLMNGGHAKGLSRLGDVLDHLNQHMTRGHQVPAYAVQRAQEEIDTFGADATEIDYA